MRTAITASAIFAQSLGLGKECTGEQSCHWCAGPCGRDLFHDEPPPIPFQKSSSFAKRPGNPWICIGCWLWRRRSVTVKFFNGEILDRQTASSYGWWITPNQTVALRQKDFHLLQPHLINPPKKFVLALLLDGFKPNQLHCAIANETAEIKSGTKLAFTVNNIPHFWSPLEIEAALKVGKNGAQAGVRLLIDHFGPWGEQSNIPGLNIPDRNKILEPTGEGLSGKRGKRHLNTAAENMNKKLFASGEVKTMI